MRRRFNTAGPCQPDIHYMVSPESRLPGVSGIIDARGYFVVHAPRQTGKTTCLRALAEALTAEGRYAALHFSCEAGRVAGDDYEAAEKILLDELRVCAETDLPPDLQPPPAWPQASPGSLLRVALSVWARACPRPLVLFFDEIDALTGDSLKAVLSQLRAGYNHRPEAFPASVALCGLRDVRDYKAASGGDPSRLGTSSPFNIKMESVRVGNFTREELELLYGQHTEDTGQVFESAALGRAWELSAGQPWLVNALAREIVDKTGVPEDQPITSAHMDEAKERLIFARQTHLDSLVARLQEPRVRRVLTPLLAGEQPGGDSYDDDFSYVRDLGLVALRPPLRVANPIYREVIVRVMSSAAEAAVTADPRSFVLPDGRLDFDLLLREFAAFWTEHGEVLAAGMPYHEVAPQLVIMAFFQRIVNGGGYIDREYGVGRGRIDLLVRWPYDVDGKRHWQRQAVELKVWRDGRPDPLDKGLVQLDAYLAQLGLDDGVLVLFDRRSSAADIAERTVFSQTRTASGRSVTVMRA